MPAQVILRDTIKLFCHTAPGARGGGSADSLLVLGVRCLLPLHQTILGVASSCSPTGPTQWYP